MCLLCHSVLGPNRQRVLWKWKWLIASSSFSPRSDSDVPRIEKLSPLGRAEFEIQPAKDNFPHFGANWLKWVWVSASEVKTTRASLFSPTGCSLGRWKISDKAWVVLQVGFLPQGNAERKFLKLPLFLLRDIRHSTQCKNNQYIV